MSDNGRKDKSNGSEEDEVQAHGSTVSLAACCKLN